MVLGVVLTVLVSVVAGIATNIITDKWKVPGGGRAVASIVVMLLIVAVGLGIAEKMMSDDEGPDSPPATTDPTSAVTHPSPDPTTPRPRPTTPADDPTTPPADPTTDRPTPVPRIVTFWSGTFRLHQVTGVELDTKPASSATGPAGNLDASDLMYDNREARGNLLHAAGGPLAEWPGTNRPDANACIEAVQTDAVSVVAPQAGQVLCVGTSGGRVARLEVLEAGYESVRFSVTVWADGS